MQGSYSYVSPDGTPISVTYTADENGKFNGILYNSLANSKWCVNLVYGFVFNIAMMHQYNFKFMQITSLHSF